jgi:hypothetical protein
MKSKLTIDSYRSKNTMDSERSNTRNTNLTPMQLERSSNLKKECTSNTQRTDVNKIKITSVKLNEKAINNCPGKIASYKVNEAKKLINSKNTSSKNSRANSKTKPDLKEFVRNKQSTSKPKSRNIEKSKIFTKVNPNHIKTVSNSNYTTMQTDMMNQVQKLTSKFALGLMKINTSYINTYLNSRKSSQSKDKTPLRSLRYSENERTLSKQSSRNSLTTKTMSSIVTKLTSPNKSTTRLTTLNKNDS